MKIGIIGHFGGNKKFMDGQTIKTKEINDYLEKYYKTKTIKFDTYKNARNPIKLLYYTYYIMKNSDIVLVILSKRGYKIITPIVMFLNRFYKKRIFDIVIGGTRYDIYKNNNLITRLSRKYEKIFVETKSIKEEYKKININNVDILYNFKSLKQGKIRKNNKEFKICTFSRVIKEKGIEEAIESVILANKKIRKDVFSLDIYGQIGKEYKKEFTELISKTPKFINYCGVVDYDKSVETLSNYDIMLFLTSFYEEGMPGTIIDAMYTGIPVIYVNWKSNDNILENGKTGVLVDLNDINQTAEKIIELHNNKELLLQMKKNCLAESKKYSPDQVMKNFIEVLEKNN